MSNLNIEYFKAILEKYLEEKYPELPDKEEQVNTRSSKALQTYRELAGKGTDHQMALEVANLELTGGFGFSLFQFLYDLVFDDFKEIPDEIRRDFCIMTLLECQKARESLSYDNMEEWEAYYHFEEKMSEVIQKAIDAGYDKVLCEAVSLIKN